MSAAFHMASKFALQLSAVNLQHLWMLNFPINGASKSKLQGLVSVPRQVSFPAPIFPKTPAASSHIETSRKYILPFDQRLPKNQKKEMTPFP